VRISGVACEERVCSEERELCVSRNYWRDGWILSRGGESGCETQGEVNETQGEVNQSGE
jgi:hypothetical protein